MGEEASKRRLSAGIGGVAIVWKVVKGWGKRLV